MIFALICCCSDAGFNSLGFDSSSSRSSANDRELDILRGGEGVTIGNGKTNEDEVEGLIIGSYLTCSLPANNKFTCTSEKYLSSVDLHQITILDANGDIISSDTLITEFTESNNLFAVNITVPEQYELNEVRPATDEELNSRVRSFEGTIPLYQSYSSDMNNHLQSFNKDEGTPSYKGHGVAFYMLQSQVENSHEIIRCYNEFNIDHYLAISTAGCDYPHKSEGIFGYLFSDSSLGKAVYVCHKSEGFMVDSYVTTDECRNGYGLKEIIGYAPDL